MASNVADRKTAPQYRRAVWTRRNEQSFIWGTR
jgi:hypothetical protein